MRSLRYVAPALVFICTAATAQRIVVTIPATAALHGHLVLVIAKRDQPEPRRLGQGAQGLEEIIVVHLHIHT